MDVRILRKLGKDEYRSDNATQTHPKLLLTQISMNAFKRGTDGMYATKK